MLLSRQVRRPRKDRDPAPRGVTWRSRERSARDHQRRDDARLEMPEVPDGGGAATTLLLQTNLNYPMAHNRSDSLDSLSSLTSISSRASVETYESLKEEITS